MSEKIVTALQPLTPMLACCADGTRKMIFVEFSSGAIYGDDGQEVFGAVAEAVDEFIRDQRAQVDLAMGAATQLMIDQAEQRRKNLTGELDARRSS
jgi:hypothetical protein